jgi:putative membrane-bound dehydrogenase-like protein
MRWIGLTFVMLGLLSQRCRSGETPPRSLDASLKVELFAELRPSGSPAALDVDELGRVWVVESRSDHETQDGEAQPTDRILVLSDIDGDAKADKTDVFADGLEHATSVAVRPAWFPSKIIDGKTPPRRSIYVATRNALLLLHDDDGDYRADRREVIVRAQTVRGASQHGFQGLTFDPLGDLYFLFRGTLKNDYQLLGADNKSLQGTKGDGGGLFRCRNNGTQLSRVATGFSNSQATCFDGFGRCFAVDQHGDSHHSGRLLHVIPEGDYGYRSRYGSQGEHPFTSWYGEIPGTLPMVAPTGAAPGGVVVYESDGLPEDDLGNLLVTSQTGHRIDRFRLTSRGSSFASSAEALIVGGDSFRPVGISCAPDGRVFCTDIGAQNGSPSNQERIWMISAVEPAQGRTLPVNVESMSTEELLAALTDHRPLVRRLAAGRLARTQDALTTAREDSRLKEDSRSRLELHWATCAANAHSDQPLTMPGEPFLRFDELKPTSTWLLLQPLIRKQARTPNHPVTTPEDFQRQHFRTCEELLASTLQGRSRDLIDPTSWLAYLPHGRLTADSPLLRLAASIDDPFLLSTMVSFAADQLTEDDFAKHLAPDATAEVRISPPRLRQLILLAARQQNPKDDSALRLALVDHDSEVRRLAVQWAAEEGFTGLRDHVDAVFQSDGITTELFLATLAAQEMLDGKNAAAFGLGHSSQYIVNVLKDDSRPDPVRTQALQLVSPSDPALDTPFFAMLLRSENSELRLEAVRTLQGAPPNVSASLLREIAGRQDLSEIQRAEAIVGLAVVAKSDPANTATRELLKSFLKRGDAPRLQRESLRAVRPLMATDPDLLQAVLDLAETLGNPPDPLLATELADQMALAWKAAQLEVPMQVRSRMSPKPVDREEWLAQLNRGRDADAEAGRRLFYHPHGPACSKCHLANGRGGRIGPDLSRTIGSMNRIQLIQSLLEPSREIAPQYINWTFETEAGLVISGLLVREENGKTIVANSEGGLTELDTSQIVSRNPQTVSIMPDKLHEQVTLQELRDLIAFLDTLR